MAGVGNAAGQEWSRSFSRLSQLADEPAGSLSYGQQKLLDAAMAFMAGPRLVLLDKPAGGVNPTMLGHLRENLHAYHTDRERHFCGDRASDGIRHGAFARGFLVLAEGRLIAEGTPQDIQS